MSNIDRWAPVFRLWLFLSAGTILLTLSLLIVWGIVRVVVAAERVKGSRKEER